MAIADKLRENHGQAAAVQQAARNGRRVIRRLADDGETPIAVEQVPMVIEQLPPPASVPRSTAHSAITLSPLDLPAEQFSAGLQRRKQNRELLMEWLRSALVDGVDYGRIHVVSKDRCSFAKQGRVKDCGDPNHWSKPSLFKPGAEKITGMLGMTTHFPSLRQYEEAVLNRSEISTIVMRCELRDAQGRVVAEGVGARNLSQDYGDINKSLKMVEKSAHIDATLRLAGLSEVFTQDIEDKPVVEESPSPALQPNAANPATNATAATDSIISREELTALRQRIARYGFTEKRVLAWLYKTTKGNVTQLDDLSGKQCDTLLKRLDSWAEAEKTFANGKGGHDE